MSLKLVFLTQGTDHCFQANACSAIFQDSGLPWQDYRGCKTPSLLGSIRACAIPHDNTNKASGGTGTRTRKRLEKQAFSDVHYTHLTTPPSALQRSMGSQRNVSTVENRAARAGIICQVQEAVSTVKEAVHLFFSSAGTCT